MWHRSHSFFLFYGDFHAANHRRYYYYNNIQFVEMYVLPENLYCAIIACSSKSVDSLDNLQISMYNERKHHDAKGGKRMAAAEKEKQKSIIGIIAAEVNSIEQRQIMKGVIEKAQMLGRKVVVFSNLYNPYEYNNDLMLENKIYELMFSQELCGLILIEESIINQTLRELLRGMLARRQDIPVCAIGIYIKELDFPNVDDGIRGMRFIAAAVASSRNGNVWTKV